MSSFKRSILMGLLGLGALLASGCAGVGAVMETYGNMSGNRSLAAAGSSFKRVAEVEEFNEDEKYYTGRTVAADLLGGGLSLSEDPKLQKYLSQVGQTVALASGKAELPHGWHFILFAGKDPDAFSAPGGIILVSEGLVKSCNDEDELAGVLAHEVAHIAIDHPMQAISAANKKAALVSLAQVAYDAANKDKAGASALSGQFASVVKDVAKGVSQGYDRGKEKEADLEAVRILVDLGYDPRGLKRVLLRLTGGDHSHGDPKERAAAVETACYEAEPVPKLLAARTDRFNNALGR